MKDNFFLSSFILAGIILSLMMKDIKNVNINIYKSINYKLFLKIYALITIGIIHLIWLFFVFLTNYTNNSYFYGVPSYLFISYILLALSFFTKKEYDELNDISKFIDSYLNYAIYAYFTVIIIVMFIPNYYKSSFINTLIKYLHRYGLSSNK
jgi:hypothetical protein